MATQKEQIAALTKQVEDLITSNNTLTSYAAELRQKVDDHVAWHEAVGGALATTLDVPDLAVRLGVVESLVKVHEELLCQEAAATAPGALLLELPATSAPDRLDKLLEADECYDPDAPTP